jgi:hypothetical protein
MPADEHLGSQFLYHEASVSDRDSIRSEGLRPGKAWKLWGEDVEMPAGVYMSPHGHSEFSSSMHDATHYGYDRWRVDVSGLDLEPDPTKPDTASLSRASIPPDRIKLAKKAHPNWKQHI